MFFSCPRVKESLGSARVSDMAYFSFFFLTCFTFTPLPCYARFVSFFGLVHTIVFVHILFFCALDLLTASCNGETTRTLFLGFWFWLENHKWISSSQQEVPPLEGQTPGFVLVSFLENRKLTLQNWSLSIRLSFPTSPECHSVFSLTLCSMTVASSYVIGRKHIQIPAGSMEISIWLKCD